MRLNCSLFKMRKAPQAEISQAFSAAHISTFVTSTLTLFSLEQQDLHTVTISFK